MRANTKISLEVKENYGCYNSIDQDCGRDGPGGKGGYQGKHYNPNYQSNNYNTTTNQNISGQHQNHNQQQQMPLLPQ